MAKRKKKTKTVVELPKTPDLVPLILSEVHKLAHKKVGSISALLELYSAYEKQNSQGKTQQVNQ